MDEVIAAYAVMFLETPIELTLNLRREAALLAPRVDLLHAPARLK